jgi:hypothetical protein
MEPVGAVRGWNSKTWKNADWGYSIWNFNGLYILNRSSSTNELFYLHMFHMDQQPHRLRLSISGKGSTLEFFINTTPIRN